MKTEVLFTVDTEFSSAGYFHVPATGRPMGRRVVDLEIDGRSHGLGFLLDTLGAYNMQATFFVEAAHVLYFGDGEMAPVVHRLAEAGQDIQLHLHPMWLACENADTPEAIAAAFLGDDMGRLDERQLEHLFNVGLQAFERWGLPRPVAARAGNLFASTLVYRIMKRIGLPVASHVGVACHRSPEAALQLFSGRHFVEGVLELPVLTYDAFGSGERLFTVTGTSFAEARHLLEAAQTTGLEQVVILTHCHEFVKRSDAAFSRIARNRVNQRRFERLCAYLATHRDRFEVTTFGARHTDWRRQPATGNTRLNVPALQAAARMMSNKLNDAIWNW